VHEKKLYRAPLKVFLQLDSRCRVNGVVFSIEAWLRLTENRKLYELEERSSRVTVTNGLLPTFFET